MDGNITYESQGYLKGIKFELLTEDDIELFSSTVVNESSDVVGPKLGVPNVDPSSSCSTCGSSSAKDCDGHYGYIELPANVCHPHSIRGVVQVLNKVCPGCKSLRSRKKNKNSSLGEISKKENGATGCKYCLGSLCERYPPLLFKYTKGTLQIIAEVKENKSKQPEGRLPKDYWNFIPHSQQENGLSFEMALSPYQVYCLLKEIRNLHPDIFDIFGLRTELIFASRVLVTPNCSRVTESAKMQLGGPHLMFNNLTKAYRKLADLNRQAGIFGANLCAHGLSFPSVVGVHVQGCLSLSKLIAGKCSSTNEPYGSGLKWVKEVVLGKRSDCSFRMVVIGDPAVRLDEIGIPVNIARELVVHEYANLRNLKKLGKCCKNIYVSRKGSLVFLRSGKDLQIGDRVGRRLKTGDLILINRPPSVHQHSVIAFSAKILPESAVMSMNPLSCAPLKGDFDGDCLQGFIPQSMACRAELSELVSLNQQLVNGQDGSHLLSLSHDSLTAAYLITGSDVLLNRCQMQQLEFLASHHVAECAILKAKMGKTSLWTGNQLFDLLLPRNLDDVYFSEKVHIKDGELLVSPNGSDWLRKIKDSLFSNIQKLYAYRALEWLYSSQDFLCLWISDRGFSVSLLDIYMSPTLDLRRKALEEVHYGLQDIDRIYHAKELLAGISNENYLCGEGNVDLSCDPKCNFGPAIVSAFSEVFKQLQSMIHSHSWRGNSLLTMINAGSKGTVQNILEQSLCLGLHMSSCPLSFIIPSKFSCDKWNEHKETGISQRETYYGVVEASFLDGLSPHECFAHSLSSRGKLFGDNADLPGTLTRKLMFYMRDLFVAYDGTVRNSYGNKLVQFSYGSHEMTQSTPEYGGINKHPAGTPVGALAACSISEAAYGALDQPIRSSGTSPLMKLKRVFECSEKGTFGDQNIMLYLSKNLQRWMYGPEYGAFKVKIHLERVILADVLHTVMIVFSKADFVETELSKWVTHLHVCQERMKRKKLTVQNIIHTVNKEYSLRRERMSLPMLKILSGCSECDISTFCITVAVDISETDVTLAFVRDELIPDILKTVIRGFEEFKKVDILWDDYKASQPADSSSGEIVLKVYLSEIYERLHFWSTLQTACMPIMDLIDWQRSFSNNIYDTFYTFGIDAAWQYFFTALKSTTLDTGRAIDEDHLLLIADCFAVTGEFHGLKAKGIKQQRDQMSISSPFMQACFANPGNEFINAAKARTSDDLLGTLDAMAWGREPHIGTAGLFEVLFSGLVQQPDRATEVYAILCGKYPVIKGDCERETSDGAFGRWSQVYRTKFERHDNSCISPLDIVDMKCKYQEILRKYPINSCLNETDKSVVMKALMYHPQSEAKMGRGIHSIKVGYHPSHIGSKCFFVQRVDGTLEDFSYRKCIIAATEKISSETGVAHKRHVYPWLEC